MPSCAGMHNARWKQGKSLAERREFRRFFQGKVLDKKQNELYRNILEHWGEAGTPVANGRVRHLDVHYGTQNQSDIAERVLAQVEHGQGYEDHMDRIAHPLEICLSKELRHGRS